MAATGGGENDLSQTASSRGQGQAARELVPAGDDATDPRPGDFILCHRRGFVSWCIRKGTRGPVSHAAFVETPGLLIEALSHGVKRTPLAAYRNVEYWIVRSDLTGDDQAQAVAFARSCLGEGYGWATIFGLALGIAWRYLTPGRGLPALVGPGTRVCSGLVAQSQVRGWTVYPFEPSACSPTDLFDYASCEGLERPDPSELPSQPVEARHRNIGVDEPRRNVEDARNPACGVMLGHLCGQ